MLDSQPVTVPVTENTQELRVKNTTDVHHLATALVKNVAEGKRVFLSCIGVQAVNQAVKSVAIANGKVAPNGFFFVILPSFDHIKLADEEAVERTKTVTRLNIRVQSIG